MFQVFVCFILLVAWQIFNLSLISMSPELIKTQIRELTSRYQGISFVAGENWIGDCSVDILPTWAF